MISPLECLRQILIASNWTHLLPPPPYKTVPPEVFLISFNTNWSFQLLSSKISVILDLFFSHIPNPTCMEILLALSSKYFRVWPLLANLYCYQPGLSHHHLLLGLFTVVSCFNLRHTISYSQRSSQRIVFKTWLRYVTSLLRSFHGPCFVQSKGLSTYDDLPSSK